MNMMTPKLYEKLQKQVQENGIRFAGSQTERRFLDSLVHHLNKAAQLLDLYYERREASLLYEGVKHAEIASAMFLHPYDLVDSEYLEPMRRNARQHAATNGQRGEGFRAETART